MRYSIITPTILRPSLVETCRSIERQKCTDWEHLVQVDGAPYDLALAESISHPQRTILYCGQNHNNWGNTCRHNAWLEAKGDYIYYLDDDNVFADELVLEHLKAVTQPWAIFPILKPKWGGLHFFCPPMRGFSDGGGMLVRRDIGRWPNVPEYDADGQMIDRLRTTQPYQALLMRPLMIYGSGPR